MSRQSSFTNFVKRQKLRAVSIFFGLAIALGLLMPAMASAATSPRCYTPFTAGATVVDCHSKSDSYPSATNGGQFFDDKCYILQDTHGAFGGFVYSDAPCDQPPFSTTPSISNGPNPTSNGAACQPKNSFFGFPTWYEYLPSVTIPATPSNPAICQPQIQGLNDVWLIVAAVIEILLRVAVLAALALIVWGGIQYIMSQGEPDKTTKARGTIINALIGLVIAIGAATLVSFLAGRFK